MSFTLPELPFDPSAFEPWCSAETFSFHHGKHHQAYVNKLNAAIEDTELADKSLDEIIAVTRDHKPGIFNNAAQHFNHDLFWKALSPETQKPGAKMAELLERDFGSFDEFKKQFNEQAATLFGSGWIWLVQDSHGKLYIRQYGNAETPGGTDDHGILPLDVWEHSYYIDHRNDRGKFIDGFWHHINWNFIEDRLS